MSILGNFFKSKKEEPVKEESVFETCAKKNPAFEGMDISKIEFKPIDGDVNRMAMYGCYAGDSFVYEGEEIAILDDMVERITVKGDEEMVKRVYSGQMEFGDAVKVGELTFYYDGYDVESTWEDEFGYEYKDVSQTRADHRDSWIVKCEEREKPLVNLAIPDEILGKPVSSIEDAFVGCKNLVSVSHIPQYIVDVGALTDAFANSGLRVIPEQLQSSAEMFDACKAAYALTNYEQVMFENKNKGRNSHNHTQLGHAVDWQRAAKNYRDEKESKAELMKGEFSPYKKHELVSFVYKFEPVRILRVQDMNDNWYAVSPANNSYITRHGSRPIVPYGEYMKKFDMTYVTDLTVESSFKELTPEKSAEIVSEAYDMMAERADREVMKHINDFLQDRYEAIDAADKAQGEFAIESKKLTPEEILDMITPKTIEKEEQTHEENRE